MSHLGDLIAEPDGLSLEHLRVANAAKRDIEALEARIVFLQPDERIVSKMRPLAVVEKEHILGVVSETKSIAEAARVLDVPLATLYRRLSEYGERRGRPHARSA